jgi:lipopolysaccharide export system ATP-binding protein
VISGGERRRTEIARALAVDPKFILLDEPFAGIDPIAVEDIQGIVAKLKYKNIGILITDHNVTETLSICDRAYLLIEGKIFKHGKAEELAADDQVRKLYLGRNFELKRKDWLHEEAFKASNAAKALESGIGNSELDQEKP